LTSVIQRQSADPAKSISFRRQRGWHLDAAIKMSAMVIFYRGHRRTLCCLHGIISSPNPHVHRNYFQIITFSKADASFTGQRRGLNSGLRPQGHCARHAVLHMAPMIRPLDYTG